MRVAIVVVIWICLASFSGGAPVCDEAYSYIEVPENTAVGTLVKKIHCEAANPATGGPLTYALKTGNKHGKFGMNTTNGEGWVFVYQAISFESRTTNFQLFIEVAENGPTRTVTNYVLDVQITGVNDYAPLFLFSPYTVYINEDKRPSTVISSPIPYDFDKGVDGSTTSVILDGDDSLFYMDPITSRVYLRGWLDYERVKDYVLTIQVTDNGLPVRRSSTTVLNIHVKDINDNPPACEESYVAETFLESRESGSLIKLLKCIDTDSGNNGRLSYTITDGDYTKFRLQGPYLVLSKPIDVDKEPNMWALTVTVSDRGSPRLSTFIDIVIFVEGVDDNGPVWAAPENGVYVIDIDEHSQIGQHVVRISADDVDSDTRDSVVLYYMDDYSKHFSIKPSTGDIFLTHDIDREEGATHSLPVSAVSHSNPAHRISTNVVINVIDINDNTPEFGQDVYHFHVREDTPVRDMIAKVSATDPDDGQNGEVVHRVTGGDPYSFFDVMTTTGEILLAGSLDFESRATHVIYLQATDRGRPSRWSSCTVIISVLPVNEFEPIFQDMDTVTIAEDVHVGASVFTVQASDGDAGLDGELVYSVETGNAMFTVESRTGTVRILTQLDRETNPEFSVILLANDMAATAAKTGSVIVNIVVVDKNDNAPTCEKYFIAIQLSPPLPSGHVVLKLNCSDVDTSVNGKLSYVISTGNKNNDFSMSSEGNLIIARKPRSAKYKLEVIVSDNGNPTLDTTVLIDIEIGGTPIINNLPSTIFVAENVPIGTSVYGVDAVSVSQEIHYRISNASDKTRAFNIDHVTGKIYTWTRFDREHVDKYTLDITVKERISGIEASGRLVINILDVNDNAPVFEKAFFNLSVIENIERNTHITTITASDADVDENAEIDYNIVSGNDAGVFRISTTGQITTRTNVDREVNEKFSLVVIATDRGKSSKLTGSTTLIISVIDADEYAPEFVNIGSDLDISLSEDTPLGANIFAMTARDLDVHKDLTFALSSQSDNHFVIDRISGDIFLSSLLDRETQDRHELVVTADGHEKVVTATVTLSVADVNDNVPVFSSNIYIFEVNETETVGSEVGEIGVADKDAGENDRLSVDITNGNNADVFMLKTNGPESYSLAIKRKLQYDTLNEYLLTIEARDNGTPQQTATTSIVVQVNPEHKIPEFTVDLEVLHMPENTHVGTAIYSGSSALKGIPRHGHDRDIVYTLEGGTTNGHLFSVKRYTGEIAVASALDSDGNGDSFVLLLVATNVYDSSLRDFMSIKIIVDDINDRTPAFTEPIYAFDVKENSRIGTNIGNVTAIDEDKGQNAFLSYAIVRSVDSDAFRLDPFSGFISLKSQLQYVNVQSYRFSVVARDHGVPSLTGTAVVLVTVIDINDQVPTFDDTSHSIHVSENYLAGKAVYTFKANDRDTGVGGEVEYTVTKGNEKGAFDLDSDYGVLTLVSKLDRETEAIHTLVVEASDKGVPPLTGTTTLTLLVTDVNDNKPEFQQLAYTATVDRFAQIETHVLTLSALDQDEGRNSDIEYMIRQGNGNLFDIDQRSGRIFTFSDISEQANVMVLTVIAKDGGSPRLSSTVNVTITITPALAPEKEDAVFTVSEYAFPNTFIGAVSQSTSSKYTIVRGNYNNNFRVTENDGAIYLQNAIDREEYPEYYMLVRVVSLANVNSWDDFQVRIEVTDENDNDPVFDRTHYSLNVLEYTPPGYSIGAVQVTDADIGDNGRVTFRLNGIGLSSDINDLVTIDNNGTLRMKRSVSYVESQHFNFTVDATDNGVVPRRGSATVTINMVNIDDSHINERFASASHLIKFEVPVYAYEDSQIGCLAPEMFGLNVVSPNQKVKYVTTSEDCFIDIDSDTGCVTFRSERLPLWDGNYILQWVVASQAKGEGSMALLRIDTFSPNQHVLVITHSVSADLLEMHRKLLIAKLQDLFPESVVRIWRIEDSETSFRRRLLATSSKSYIYIIRDNSTLGPKGVESETKYVHQDELMHVFRGQDGGISHALTSEDFDAFPVTGVEPYRGPEGPEKPWIITDIGKIVTGLVLAFVIFSLLMVVVICELKKNKNTRKQTSDSGAQPHFLPPCRPIDPKYNNLRRSSSTPDMLPLMNALKALSGMSETDRNRLIQETLRLKEPDRTKSLPKQTLNLSKTANLDEVWMPRKVSNEDAADMLQSKKSKARGKTSAWTISSLATVAPANDTDNEIKESKNNKNEKAWPLLKQPYVSSRTGSDTSSLSSLTLQPSDTDADVSSAKNDVMHVTDETTDNTRRQTNGPIVIGGKEYDGVGKDTTTGGKYLYNTSTGDKIHVTSEILERAVKQRQSVVNTDFTKDNRGAKMSTFKRPTPKRKTSRSRFSTTTIWEMSVGSKDDADYNIDQLAANDDVDDDSTEQEKETASARRRRIGMIDNTKGQRMNLNNRQEPQPNSQAEQRNNNGGYDDTVYDMDDSDSDDREMRKNIIASGNWDKILSGAVPQFNTSDDMLEDADGVPYMRSRNDEDNTSGMDRWTKAKKLVRFVRPVYKPINLENVTCKVPKGKSDPKDCLSKDPVYAGWAKMVGRRLKTKTVKRKDGGDKTVTIRQGRSLPGNIAAQVPLNVFEYTKAISSQLPPHLNRKRLSIDVDSI